MSDVVLALDVGTRRIGVAVGEGTFAFPHSTIHRTNVRDDVAGIVALARERGARTIVVGDPLTMSGERGPATESIDAFVAHLARAADDIVTWHLGRRPKCRALVYEFQST